MKSINSWLHNKNDYDNVNHTITGYIALLGFISHVLMEFQLLAMGMTIMATYNIIPILLMPLCLVLNHEDHTRQAVLIIVIETALASSIATFTGGWSLGYYLYYLSAMSLMFFTTEFKTKSKLVTSFIIVMLMLMMKLASPSSVSYINDSARLWIYLMNAASVVMNLALVYLYFDHMSKKLKQELIASGELHDRNQVLMKDNKAIGQEISRISQEFSLAFESNLALQEQIDHKTDHLITLNNGNVVAYEGISRNTDELDEKVEGLNQRLRILDQASSDVISMSNSGRESMVSYEMSSNQNLKMLNGLELTLINLKENIEGVHIISDVIDKLSYQTNLLALNASIEAAKAGEHGRGFSVVANQIKQLAHQSKQSTEEIAKLIHFIKDGIQEANHQMNKVKSASDVQTEVARKTLDGLSKTLNLMSSITSNIQGVNHQLKEVRRVKESIVKTMFNLDKALVDSTQAIDVIKDVSCRQNETMMESYEIHEDLKRVTGQLFLES